MPQQIDVCRSCSSPIYDADGVTGSCACTNGMYQALAVRQRLANQRGTTRVASVQPAGRSRNANGDQLPPLDPTWFMSPQERRTMQAAVQDRNIPQRRPERHLAVMTDDPTDGFNDLDLADAPRSFGDEISFDTGSDISFDTSELQAEARPMPSYHAARAARFDVTRPPAHEPFNAPRPQSPQVREVTRVANGRFAVLREETYEERIERFAETVARSTPVRPPNPMRPTREEANRAFQEKQLNTRPDPKLPTAYDRIAGDFLADADAFD